MALCKPPPSSAAQPDEGGVLEHGGRVSKYPRGGSPGAGVDCARVRGASSDVRPSHFNKAFLPAAAVRSCGATDRSVRVAVHRRRKFVGPTTAGER